MNTQTPETEKPLAKKTIRTFPARGAGDLMQAMFMGALDEVQTKGITALVESELEKGAFVRVLFSDEAAGMSLTYAWFKKGYPLPRHSHSADCLYYIISGEMRYGTECMRAGDVMHVPAGSLYTFETIGENGAEFIEFRTQARYDIVFKNSEKAWARNLDDLNAHKSDWDGAEPPLAARRMTGEA